MSQSTPRHAEQQRHPALGDRLANYWREDFSYDAKAALNVAAVAIPQSMAYAMIAGLPPVYGLYTSVVSTIVASLLGCSKHLVTGPSNATSLIFAATLTAYQGELTHLEAAFFYTALIGVIKLLFGILRLGSLMHFVSDSVIIGFMAGAGVLIAGKQIAPFLGVDLPAEAKGSFFQTLVMSLSMIDQAHWPTCAVAASVAAAQLLGQKLLPKLPTALLLTVITGLLAALLDFHDRGIALLGDIGGIERHLGEFTMISVDFSAVSLLLSGAFAVAVIGSMEAIAISKSIAISSGQRIDSNREFVAQGVANIVGAFFQNYASSGSFARSAVNWLSGARTRFASAISGVLVGLVVLLVGPFGEYIPIATISGLLVVLAFSMVRWESIKLAWRAGKQSAFIMILTFAATITLRVDLAIYVGVAASLAFFIRESSETSFTLLVSEPSGRFREIDEDEHLSMQGRTPIVNVIGSLCFGGFDDLTPFLERLVQQRPRAIVLRLRRISTIDASTIASLERIHKWLVEDEGIPLLICGVDDALYARLKDAGVVQRIGKRFFVKSRDLVMDSLQESLVRAEKAATEKEPIAPARERTLAKSTSLSER